MKSGYGLALHMREGEKHTDEGRLEAFLLLQSLDANSLPGYQTERERDGHIDI